MKQIDLNCDMGESFGQYQIGNDAAIMPLISSCNIACGFHAGDPMVMDRTINLALEHKVQIGAHPGYPDLAGFGRRQMQIDPAELRHILKYQIGALKGMVESYGARLAYVKPHGALYNTAAQDEKVAMAVASAVSEIDDGLLLMGLAGSLVARTCEQMSIRFVAEAFADRRYRDNGSLCSRKTKGAVLDDPEEAAQQVLRMVIHEEVKTETGKIIPLQAQSFCIHGDNPAALDTLKSIHRILQDQGIIVSAF